MKIFYYTWIIIGLVLIVYLAQAQTPTPAPKPFPCKPTVAGKCTGVASITCTQTGDFSCVKLPTAGFECKATFTCDDICSAIGVDMQPDVRLAKIEACRKYSLQPSSPAIGLGDEANCPKTNFMGHPRPAGSCNAGAF